MKHLRECIDGETVRVHFNLRTHLWSITSKGKVIAHHVNFALENVTFPVSEASRQRVIRDHCREVHAWAQGSVATAVTEVPANAVEFTYNPYRSGSFTLRDGSPISGAKRAWFVGKKAYIER